MQSHMVAEPDCDDENGEYCLRVVQSHMVAEHKFLLARCQ